MDSLKNTGKNKDSPKAEKISSQNYYRELFNLISDPILVFNASEPWELLEINQAVTELTGFAREDFPSFIYTFQNLDTPFNLQEALVKNHKAAAGEPQVFDWLIRRRDGAPLWLEVVLKKINLNGIHRLLCMARDISKRRELSNRLENALEAAEASSRAQEIFLAGLGHELRASLFGITGMAELLLSTKLSEKQRDYAAAILESSSILSSIITGVYQGWQTEPATVNQVSKSTDLHTILETMLRSSPQYNAVQTQSIPEGRQSDLGACSILIVDDDPVICDYLTVVLGYEGYSRIRIAKTAQEAISLINNLPPDAVILDCMLPDISGPRVCTTIKGLTDSAIIMISARDDVENRVACLKAGADDYLLKPFRFEELLARMESLLRRRGYVSKQDFIAYADLRLWPGKRMAFRQDRLMQLTPTEFNLLHLFMINPGQVLSKDLILQHLRGYDYRGDENIAEVYVRYLRRKLGSPQLIHTRRGIGYVMNED